MGLRPTTDEQRSQPAISTCATDIPVNPYTHLL